MINKHWKKTVLICMPLLAACSSKSVNDYSDWQPKLVPETFFQGELTAHGVVKNRQGDVTRHFSANIDASWENGVGTLDEQFTFNDGELQNRVWTLTAKGEGKYVAQANDVIGEHAMQVSGNALFMKYVLRLPYNGKTLDVTVDDKMFLVSEKRIINESVFYKWGFEVASVQLVIEKQ